MPEDREACMAAGYGRLSQQTSGTERSRRHSASPRPGIASGGFPDLPLNGLIRMANRPPRRDMCRIPSPTKIPEPSVPTAALRDHLGKDERSTPCTRCGPVGGAWPLPVAHRRLGGGERLPAEGARDATAECQLKSNGRDSCDKRRRRPRYRRAPRRACRPEGGDGAQAGHIVSHAPEAVEGVPGLLEVAGVGEGLRPHRPELQRGPGEARGEDDTALVERLESPEHGSGFERA